jgi:hypothetical protein
MEAAISRRLDHHTRNLERLEHHVKISNEAIALFVRFWLTTAPTLPDSARAAAQASGNSRYKGFVEVLGRRIEKGQSLAVEISEEFDQTQKTSKDL